MNGDGSFGLFLVFLTGLLLAFTTMAATSSVLKCTANPRQKVPEAPDNGTQSPAVETEHLERPSQTRYFLEYALALANLSRRAENCTTHSGPISPAQATELCSELETLDNKLNFHHLLGGGAGRGGEGNGSVSGSACVGGTVKGSACGHVSNERRLSVQ